jgi:hypothetical protein
MVFNRRLMGWYTFVIRGLLWPPGGSPNGDGASLPSPHDPHRRFAEINTRSPLIFRVAKRALGVYIFRVGIICEKTRVV